MQFGDKNFIQAEMLKHQRDNMRRELEKYAEIVEADGQDGRSSEIVQAAALRCMQELESINDQIETLEREALNA